MNVLFWFRKSEAKEQMLNSDPLGTIQCRVTIDNNDCELGSTKISCKKSLWDPSTQVVSGSLKRIVRANQKLEAISTTLLRLHDVLSTKYDYVTPSLVKEYFLEKRKFTYTMQEVHDAYFVHREKQKKQGAVTKSTLTTNQNYSRHILDYIAATKIIKPIHIQANFFNDLFDFMIDEGRSGERFARKVSVFSKHVLKWAVRKGMAPRLACFDEDLPGQADSEDYLDTTHLDIVQIDRLAKFSFEKLVSDNKIQIETAEMLGRERDAFVFNCFTGMHHCDYSDKLFCVDQYQGHLFLKGNRKKTKKAFAIKLLEPAVDIIRRYDGDLGKLPVKSNQKRNQALKQIATLVQIPLLLTTKVARKTFCDLALNEMLMTQDDVAACLGLTSTRYLKNYGRIREKRLLKVMPSWASLEKAC
jgi:hypothetical protein